MHALVHLRKATVQKVLLTATLTPEHEATLMDHVGISRPARTLILRSPTARPNHRVQIALVPPPQSVLDVGARLASFLLESWDKDPAVRGIIFVRATSNVEAVRSSCPFPTCAFYGKMPDQEKESQFSSWLSDKDPAKWMVSTTALLHGVDYPRVDAVIFVGCPFGVYDLVQGAGRAGRAGQESLIAVLHNGISPVMNVENQYDCRPQMERIIKDKSCRRFGVSKVMDGEGLICSQLQNSLPCDFCEGSLHPLVSRAINEPSPTPHPQSGNVDNHMSTPPSTQPTTAGHVSINTPPPTPPAAAGHIPINTTPLNLSQQGSFLPRPPPRPSTAMLLNGYAAQSAEDARKEHARRAVKLMDRYGGCFTCRINSNGQCPCHEQCGSSGMSGCSIKLHPIFSCTTFSHKSGWIDWRKDHIRWQNGRCFFCGIPFDLIKNDHLPGEQSRFPGRCRFSDTLVGAAWHVLHTADLFQRIQTEMGFTPESDTNASFARWLLEFESDRKDLRIISVFLWLCEQYYPGCGDSV